MLVLTRRTGETLVINDDISISILGVVGGQVRIGIDAPKHVSVHRQEIWMKIKSEEEGKGFVSKENTSDVERAKGTDPDSSPPRPKITRRK